MTDILGQTDDKLKSKSKIQSLKTRMHFENKKSGLGNQSTCIPFWIYNRQTDGNSKWQPKREQKNPDFKNQNQTASYTVDAIMLAPFSQQTLNKFQLNFQPDQMTYTIINDLGGNQTFEVK